MYVFSINVCTCHPQVPHSVTVIVPGSETKMITVQCAEPQRIYDLLKKYGLTSSNVWNSTIALSARSPCKALCDHDMTIVNVNRIPHNDTFGGRPKVSNFYHNMRHVRVQTDRLVFRHKPYTMPLRRPVDIPPPPPPPEALLDLPRSSAQQKIETEIECIPVALYYDDNTSKLSDVIEADGRFVPSAQCVDPAGGGDKYIVEVDPADNLIIKGETCCRKLYVIKPNI